MYGQLKSEIREIIEIVNECPEALREKCFEMLLENYLFSVKEQKSGGKELNLGLDNADGQPVISDGQEGSSISKSSNEILLTDFHVKIQRFLSNSGIDIKVINDLYYKEGGKICPLYESLHSTKMSECQIRLALLTAFENSYSDANGEMYFNGEDVRQRCIEMKCYDAGNFTKNFKNSSSLFENWAEKYDKMIDYTLSFEGKKELARVLIELARGE